MAKRQKRDPKHIDQLRSLQFDLGQERERVDELNSNLNNAAKDLGKAADALKQMNGLCDRQRQEISMLRSVIASIILLASTVRREAE